MNKEIVEALKAALEFAQLSQKCPHNCGPNCCAEGKERMLRAEVLAVQLQDVLNQKDRQP